MSNPTYWDLSGNADIETVDLTLKPTKKQVGGSHYKDYPIAIVDFIEANNLSFCQGNIIKYVCRYKDKGGIEDLDKAIHYIEILKERYEANK